MKNGKEDGISALIDKIAPEVVAIRQGIHMHPELSFEEHRTSRMIRDYLNKLNIEPTIVATTGVVGTLLIDEAYPTIAVRAEMDAVPMQEQNQCEYASQIPGVMHACGHDGIVAVALGLAKLLASSRDKLRCNVKFLFQPAEETGKGANAMIEAGVLENPKVEKIIVFHFNNFAQQALVLARNTATVATGVLKIKVLGKSAHWAERKRGSDAIGLAARVVLAVEEFNDTYESKTPFVVGAGVISGGTRTSIISDSAEIKCTLRAQSRNEQQRILECLKKKLLNMASERKAKIEMDFTPGCPPLVNDPVLVELVSSIGEEIFGSKNVLIIDKPPLAGDDAAYYFEKVQGIKLSFCGRFKDRENYPIHNPRFDFDERILSQALRTLHDLIIKMDPVLAAKPIVM